MVTDTGSGTPITPTGTVSMTSSRSGTFTTCTLSGSSGNATCASTYTPGAGSEGSITVTASYPGDAPHSGSSSTTTVTSTIRSSSTSLLCTPFPDPVGAPATCTVTITDSSPGTTFTPTGTITFSDSPTSSGTFSSTTCTLVSGACSVSYTPSIGNEGSIAFEATYGGDTDHTGSSSTFSLTAVERTTSTTISCNSSEVLLNLVATCTVTVADTSGGTKITPSTAVALGDAPAFSGTFSSTSCNPTGTGGTATCSITYSPSAIGLHTLFANYTGEPDLLGSSGSVAVNSYDYTITVTSSVTVLRGTSATYTVTLTLVSGSTGTIPAQTLSVLGLPSDSTFTFTPAAKIPTTGGANSTLTVNTRSGSTGSLGDFPFTVAGTDPGLSGGSHSASSSVGIYDYSITISPSSQAILRGDTANYNVTVSLSSGSTTTALPATILLSSTGAPGSSTVTLASPVPFPTSSSNPTVTPLTIETSGSTPGGTFTLTVTGNVGVGTRTGSATLTVIAPSITLNPAAGIVGSLVTVSGSNFAPSSNITVTFDSITVATTTTDASGLFSTSFTVAPSVFGAHTVKAADATHYGLATYTVSPAIALSPSNGIGGTVVTVSGTGFAASSTINIKYDGTTQPTTPTTVTSSSVGSFTATFTVPGASPNGAHTVTATDASSHSATATFSIIASITLSSTSGIVGSTVAVTGRGFAASSTITIKYDGTTVTTTPTPVTTNTAGSFSASFTVPVSANGPHAVTATDAASHTATASYTVVGSITLTPTSGQTGSSFTVTGTGFSGSSSITVTFDTTIIGGATTGTTGSFSGTYTVPVTTVGPHNVTATDAFSHTAIAVFTLTPGITLSPTSGTVGSLVTVSGTSFTPSSTVTITFSGSSVATVSTDSSGLFTASFSVPASTFGAHTVTATDASSRTASATYSVIASIALSPTGGPVGTVVTITGTGFAASSTITIRYDGTTVATSPTTVASSTIGSFSATFTAPVSTNGAHTVTATDVALHSANAIFTISASISLSPSSGIPGGTVTVSGTGFAASSTINIKYDGTTQPTTPTTVTSSSVGSFTATFTVPGGSPIGAHTVTAVDGVGNTASSTFTVVPSVTEQITVSVASGVPTNTGTLTGCSVNPSTIAFDGNQHNFAALPSCSITITVPTDGTNTRFRFAGSATTVTVTTCSSGTCPSATVISYYQLRNTYTATPTNPVTWDAPLSITVTGTIAGSAPFTGCSINTVNGGGSVSCQGWFDYNTPVTVTSPVAVSSSEQWSATTTNTFTDVTAPITHTVSYTDQFRVSLAASPSTGGTTNPSGTTGWLDYGSTVTITETPLTGYTFTAWTSSTPAITLTTSSPNTVTATVRGAGTVTANFVKGLDCFASASSTTASISVVLTNCRSNDVIIVLVTQDSASTVFSMSDTGGTLGGYSRRISDNQGGLEEVEEWWARVGLSNITSTTITATLTLVGGGAHHSNIIAVGFAGISAGSPFDTNTGLPIHTGAGNGQPTVTGVTTSNANDIIVAMVGSQGPNSDTAGGAFFLITSRNQLGEVGSIEYSTVSSTLSGATVTFDTTTTIQSHWVMIVDALVRVASQVAQPVTLTTINTNIDATINVSGCNVVPTSLTANGAQNTLAADPSCTLTFTVPADITGERYRFSNAGSPSTTWTVAVCATGTCTPTSNNVYFQRLQKLSYSVSGGGSPPAPTFSATQFNSPFGQLLTTTATGYWFDNGASWTVTDPITGGTGEKWQIDTGTQADTGTISSAQTIVFTYVHQYFLTVTSAQDTPTPVSGWFNAGTSIAESVTSPVSGGTATQYVAIGWTGTGSVPASGASSSVTFTINAASSITWNWQTQYLLTIQTNGLPSSHPTAIYLGGVSSGTASDTSPFSLWLNSGVNTGTLGVDPTINGGPSVGYFFTQWDDSSTSNPRTGVSVTAPVTYTANYNADTTPPVIVVTATPAPNADGWNNQTVTVSWSVSDPDSGVASSSGCGTTTLSSETAGTTVTCTASNGAGLTNSLSVTVKIDKTAPTITSTTSPTPNAYGWNNADVTLTFSCNDPLSGVATPQASPQVLSSEATGQSASATCKDRAGNSASATVNGINIDKTSPTITSSRSAAANVNGWNNVTVTVSFTCSDTLSGVLSSPPPTTLGEGGGQSVTGTCLDRAGNSASVTESNINIDLTPPTITSSRSVQPNANGWNNVQVTVSFTCSDALSGVSSSSSPTTLGEGAGQSVTGNCTDLAGNSANATDSGINVDLTLPVLTGSRSPSAGSNGWNNVQVTVSFTCSDALSGVSSSSSPTTLGEGAGQSVTGTCLDRAGNSASATESNINIDLTPPTITSSRSVQPNVNGWNNVQVTVSFTCSDALSGVSSASPPTTLGEGASQSVNGDCTDNAGNSAATSDSNINIDLTLPSITGSRSPGANSFGWNNATVTVSLTCTDSLSGVDSSSTPTSLDEEGPSQSATGTCVDKAGNSSSATIGDIDIDLTPPTITSSRSVQPNANGWNNVPVTVSFLCTDPVSGADSVTGPSTFGEGQGQSVAGTCFDRAGNSASTTATGINIDLTLPYITGSLSPTPNANGWVNSSARASFTCSDSLSGVAYCSPPTIPSGEGFGQSVTGFVTDLAGNNASATVSNINIDKTLPVITGSRSPSANADGWTNVAVSVSFSCNDPLSGVDSYSPSSTVSGEGQAQSLTGTCTDKAGNTASSTVGNINIDLTPPTVTGSRDTPEFFGGTFGPVTVTFRCTDALSGVANVTSPVIVRSGRGQSVSGTCADKAGNRASAIVSNINVGLNTSLVLILILGIVAALSLLLFGLYMRRRRHKFIWDAPSTEGIGTTEHKAESIKEEETKETG